MNDIFNRNRGLEFEENDNLCVDRIASAAEKVLESAMDTSADREAIEELTATEGFRKSSMLFLRPRTSLPLTKKGAPSYICG